MRIAITGGTGFVGGYLTSHCAAGHEVTVLARRTPPGEPSFISFSLDAGVPSQRLEGFDALIHAAYDFAARDDSNVAGSVRLFKSAKAAGVAHIVFISSLSAFDGCRSRYGGAKLAVERELAGIGGCAVRLGFVYDESGKGLSGALKRLARLPLVPLPAGGAQSLFTIHANDLGPAFLRILHRRSTERSASRILSLSAWRECCALCRPAARTILCYFPGAHCVDRSSRGRGRPAQSEIPQR